MVIELSELCSECEVTVDEERLTTSLVQIRERQSRVATLLLRKLVLRNHQEDLARVRRQTAHDVRK